VGKIVITIVISLFSPFSVFAQYIFQSGFEERKEISGIITPEEGGTVSLAGIIEVVFPPGAFEENTNVVIYATQDSATNDVFQDTKQIYDVGLRLAYEIIINVGSQQPTTDVVVTIVIPEALRASVPEGSNLIVMGQNYWDSEWEVHKTFEVIGPIFPVDMESVTVSIPVSFFTDGLSSDGTFEATITLGVLKVNSAFSAMSLSIQQASDPNIVNESCVEPTLDDFIFKDGIPVNPDCTNNQCWGTRPSGDHKGADYSCAAGDSIQSPCDGSLSLAGWNNNGWGWTIGIKCDNGGYWIGAHMKAGSLFQPPPGENLPQRILRRNKIGECNNSGSSRGNHLHAEWAPDLGGEKFNDASKVDPDSCTGKEFTVCVACDSGGLTVCWINLGDVSLDQCFSNGCDSEPGTVVVGCREWEGEVCEGDLYYCERDLTGTWQLSLVDTATNCEGDEIDGSVSYATVSITQEGSVITVCDEESNCHDGSQSGNSVVWNGSFDEDGGTTTVSLTMILSDDGNEMSGTDSWSWTDGDYSCSGMTDVTVTRQ
jgi:hypothetical protein